MKAIRMGSSLRIAVAVSAALAMAACLGACLAPVASARPDPLIAFPADKQQGESAGRFGIAPFAIASSPVTGEVYVVDLGNHRINVFTAWGQFIRAFGWNVDASDPAEELQTCTPETGCKKGSSGSGLGQIGEIVGGGITVDPMGNVYVGDLWASRRIQKFSSTGEFLLAFGGSGTGDGEFSTFGTPATSIGTSPDGESVYVGDRNRIQEFGSDGSFKSEITFKSLHEQMSVFPETGQILALVADPNDGELHISVSKEVSSEAALPYVFTVDPDSGKLLGEYDSGDLIGQQGPEMGAPKLIAVDSDENLYVFNAAGGSGSGLPQLFKFDPVGNLLIPNQGEQEAIKKENEEINKGFHENPFSRFPDSSATTPLVWGIGTNGGCGTEEDILYIGRGGGSFAYVEAYGPPPQDTVKCPPPPPGVPEVGSQYATSVGTDSAVLGAEINPRYALDTTYYVEYGTSKCSEGGCTSERPSAPGPKLTKKVSTAFEASGGVVLSGLQPDTTYYYRFVANSSGGGPVRGEESSFTTFPEPRTPLGACPNQVFRTGPSAQLPDCRAYEVVSPLERSPAGDIVPVGLALNEPAEYNQSAADGDKLTFSSEFAFGDAVGSPSSSQYISSRVAGAGWSTHAVSPPQGPHRTFNYPNLKLDTEEKGFTEDLCTSWLMHVFDPPLSSDAIEGYTNLYKRHSCGSGGESYESVSAPEPPLLVGSDWAELQGMSKDGSTSVFRANARLTSDAPDLGNDFNQGKLQLYWEKDGLLRFVCRLPNGDPLVGRCSAGTPGVIPDGRRGTVAHALSADGSRVYWTTKEDEFYDTELYLRENAGKEQSAVAAGKCTEEEKACTYAVASGDRIQFWTASDDGSIAFYSNNGQLREYSAESRKSTTIAKEAVGVAGASEDGSMVYFASREALGGEGVKGKPNFYLRAEGETKLIGTLSENDMSPNPEDFPIGPVAARPRGHGARITPDGQHLLFASNASLTGYDNRDTLAGRPDYEVFLYDAGAEAPVCISCNPTGARPLGRQIRGSNEETRGFASLIPGANSQLYAPRALSEDGNRAFFESYEALVARDVNGKRDVYEWQRAGGEADCDAIGADMYVESSGGCLSLISSGESPADSQFIDAGRDGRDVFIRTAASLVPDDPGLIDIYDARIGGGFAPKPPIPPSCEGEACQSPPAPPNDPTPASSTFQGSGNVVDAPAKAKKKSKKAKKKAHKKAKKKQRSNRHRGAAR